VKGDKSAEEKLPKVMKDAIKSKPSSTPSGSRSYSTMVTPTGGSAGFDPALMAFNPTSAAPTTPGLKFHMPTLPIPKDAHVKHRYDPIVEQVTNLLMRDGKKSVAQRVCIMPPPLTFVIN
jgi:small subunit ribosomal protein S7